MTSHLMQTYAPQPVAFARGEGVWLWDLEGKRYLDALAGIAVNGLGHAHPVFTRAIAAQAAKLIHTSNLFQVPEQERAAEKVCALAAMDNAFFCNSGAEANECAIKIARLHGHQRGIENATIIVMEKAWHGRTLATLSATGSRKAQAGFEPLMGGFLRVPYNDAAAIERIGESNASVVAILMEVLQGEGGIHVADAAYVRKLREICDRRQWLLMIGVELDRPCGDIVRRALAAGLVTNVTADKVVRLVPPLIIQESEARQIVSILAPIIKAFLSEAPAAAAAA